MFLTQMAATMADAAPHTETLGRSCGQFIGHIVAACRTKVDAAGAAPACATPPARTVRAAINEQTVDGVTFRRIVVDQVIEQVVEPAQSPFTPTPATP